MLLLLLRRQTLHRTQFDRRESLHSILNSAETISIAVHVLLLFFYCLSLFIFLVIYKGSIRLAWMASFGEKLLSTPLCERRSSNRTGS